MKDKKKYLVIILAILIVFSSGCTKYLSNGKERVVNELTGQTVTSNILCLPEDKDLVKIYEKNKKKLDVDYDSLSKCEKFKPSDLKYKSLWESVFIKPLAWLIIKIGVLVKNYGLSVMIVGALIRIILIPFTKKSLSQSENMKKAQPELNAIQKKYENAKDQNSQMMMSQEMMMVYKKYNMNPASGCIIAFIQLPILFAFLEAINRIPAVFEGYFLGLQLGTSPFVGIKQGNYMYILLILLIIGSTYFSYKNSMMTGTGNSEQDKQTNMMMKFMIIFISIASFSLPTALALYWIVSNLFMIVQNMFIKKNSDKSTKKRKTNVKNVKAVPVNNKKKGKK